MSALSVRRTPDFGDSFQNKKIKKRPLATELHNLAIEWKDQLEAPSTPLKNRLRAALYLLQTWH
ncbi:MAG: hypothetical protein ACJAWL_001176 [Motiliproteus sp.]|jgi:hypothetical protein